MTLLSPLLRRLGRLGRRSRSGGPRDVAVANDPGGVPAAGPARTAWDRPMLGQEMASLFATLRPLLDDQGKLVLHVLSCTPGEGASTIARELAVIAASNDWCRVLLVDAGGGVAKTVQRNTSTSLPAFNRTTGAIGIPLVPSSFGMTAFDLTEVPGLSSGVLGNPATIKSIYNAARERYTLVIVDLPAIATSRDSAALSLFADGVLMVVESGKARVPVIKHCQASIEAAGGQILGVVFNKKVDYIPSVLYKRI